MMNEKWLCQLWSTNVTIHQYLDLKFIEKTFWPVDQQRVCRNEKNEKLKSVK